MNPALLSRSVLLLCCLGLAGRLHAQGTAFTYQGSLADDSGPATGTYDFQFTVFDAASDGNPVGAVTSLPGQAVANGLFTVTVDPGATVFTGLARWLEIAVRTNGAASFSTLAIRQPLTPTPYAIHAATAGSAATATLATTATTASSVAAAGVAGTLTAGQLPASVAYRTGGNAFTGDQSVMGGKVGIGTTSPGAALQVSGNFISGGANTVDPATIEAAILGGTGNVIQSNGGRAIIGGGANNTIESGAGSSIIGSGQNNSIRASTPYSVVGGGTGNEIRLGSRSFIGGGDVNNISSSTDSFIGGGRLNSLQTNDFSAVVGGYNNKIYPGANYASIGGGVSSAIGEGAYQAAVGGGAGNVIEPRAYMSVIAGGRDNVVRTNAVKAAIGGGQLNRAGGQYATVPGGQFNDADGNFSLAAGRRAKAGYSGDFVWADSQNADFTATAANQFLIRAQGGVGIGTASPNLPLDVSNNDSNGTGLGLKNPANDGTAWSLRTDGSATLGNHYSIHIRDDFSAANRLTIDGLTGSVGIGTNAPKAALHVVGDIRATGVISGDGSGLTALSAAGITGTLAPAQLPATVAYRTGGNAFIGDQTVMSGKVGVGTTTPAAQLDVTGAIRSQGQQTTHAQGAYIEWNKDGGGGQTWLLNHKGLGAGGMIFGEVDDANTVTEGMRLSGQDLKVKGNVKMGTSPEVFAMGATAVSRTIAGNIFSSGPSINVGTGFSVAKLAVGRYQITYTTPGSYSIVTATPVNGNTTISTTSAGGSSVVIEMRNLSTALVDSDFSFIAVVAN